MMGRKRVPITVPGRRGALARRTRRERHGAYARRVNGRLPARLAWLQPAIDEARAGVESDLGGDLTTAQRLVLDATLEAHVVRRLLGHNMLARGATTRSGELRPAAKAYVSYLNSERLGFLALGLERRARNMDSYVAEVMSREKPSQRPASAAGGRT